MERKSVKLQPGDIPELWKSVPTPKRPFRAPASLANFEFDLPEISEEDEKVVAELLDLKADLLD